MDEGVKGTGKGGEGRVWSGNMEGGWVLGEAKGWNCYVGTKGQSG